MYASSKDIKTFKNPSGFWEHYGRFSVELTDDADESIVPDSAKVEGNTVTVTDGRIKQVMAGIQFHSQGSPFAWDYSCIRAIRDGKGNLLWVNDDYR